MMQSIGLPLLIIAASVGFVMMYTVPKYDDIEALKNEEAALDNTIRDAEKIDERISELKTQFDNFPRDIYNRLQVMLPGNVEPIDVVVEVNSIARNSAVAITAVSEREKQATDQANFFYNPSPVETISTSYSMSADYSNFLEFMRNIELGLRLTDISSVDFSISEETGLLDISIETDTYSLKQ